MALTTINGRDGTADFTIATVSYECILNDFEVTSNVEMTNADTFCIEGTADQEPGREQLRFRIAGLLKKGAAASGPLIPAPQNVALVFTFSTGCTIGFNANFDTASARRIVNQNALLTATGLSKGTFAVAWDDGTP